MADKTYLWIGGAGSGMDRFDFNFPGNWVEVDIDLVLHPSDPDREQYIPTSVIPQPGDKVWVGTHQTELLEAYYHDWGLPIGIQKEYRSYVPPRFLWFTRAPLLFGGFSGDENGGIWLDKFGQGTSGTTWNTSLKQFIFGVNDRPEEIFGNPISANRIGYGFPVLGGGITQSTATALKQWYPELQSALQNATQRQKDGLKLKVDFVRIDKQPLTTTDWASLSAGLPNFNYLDPNKLPPPPGLSAHTVDLRLVKNYGYNTNLVPGVNVTQNDLNKYYRNVVTTVGGRIWQTNIKLVNSLINNVNINSNSEHYNANPNYIRYNKEVISGNSIELRNCKVWTVNVSGNAYHTFKTTYDTLFFKMNSGISMAGGFTASLLSVLPTSKIEGTGNALSAYRALYTSITGPSINTTPATININYKENYNSSYCPHVMLGAGLTGAQVFAYGTNLTRSNLILEPGIFIPYIKAFNYYVVAPRTQNSLVKMINVAQIDLESSILDLYTTDRNVWKIGYVQGITLIGGINMNQSSSIVGGSKTRLLNYVVVKNINKRTGGSQPNILNSPLTMAEEIENEAR